MLGHRKHNKMNIDSPPNEIQLFVKKKNRRRCDSSSSSSSSSSDSDYCRSRSCERKHRRRRSSSSSSSDKECLPYEAIYNFMKCRLAKDDDLMVAGSTAYANAVNITGSNIPQSYPTTFNTDLLQYNVEHLQPGLPYFVREDGVYFITFTSDDDNVCQFTIFVNNVEQENTRTGNNSGSGQFSLVSLLRLRKNDNVVVRNYQSAGSIIETNLFVGGTNQGSDMTILLYKIAPYNDICVDWRHKDKFERHLSYNKKRLFCKLLEDMLADKQLMMQGFNVRGSFFNRHTQTVATEADVVFDTFTHVNGLVWNPTGVNPEQIKVLEDGIYNLFGLLTTNTAAQFALTINGVPIDNTVSGSNRGAGQISIRTLLELKANDIVTIRNHTSANGLVVISENAGGVHPSISAILTLIKIAPITKINCCKSLDVKHEHKYICLYEKFKTWMLYNNRLQIIGSPAYASINSTTKQLISLGNSVIWENNNEINNIYHQQGNSKLVIERDGIYLLNSEVITNESAQYTVFINGVPDMTTTFGRDSGASKTILRQLVKLNRGDTVTVRNHESHYGTLVTAVNAGGLLAGINCSLNAFMLSPICLDISPCPPCPPCPPCKPCKPNKPNKPNKQSKQVKTEKKQTK
jgi:hypothetical protein